jgi:hypothetical protein
VVAVLVLAARAGGLGHVSGIHQHHLLKPEHVIVRGIYSVERSDGDGTLAHLKWVDHETNISITHKKMDTTANRA